MASSRGQGAGLYLQLSGRLLNQAQGPTDDLPQPETPTLQHDDKHGPAQGILQRTWLNGPMYQRALVVFIGMALIGLLHWVYSMSR